MTIQLYKYQGAGNDFVLLDNRKNQFSQLNAKQVKFICDRHFGVGADGLMLLNVKDGYDFEMVYFNADGNTSSMCGNGGRCIVQFAFDQGIALEEYNFLAVDGPHAANFDEHRWIRLQMKNVDQVERYQADYILDTGSPHYVKFMNDVMQMDVFREGRNIRYHVDFKRKVSM
jgi:diaminopimelate epimerase